RLGILRRMPCKNVCCRPRRVWLGRVALGGLLAGLLLGGVLNLQAVLLWSDVDARVVHHSGDGYDILGGKVKRDDSTNDVLYFKFHVDPLSDVGTEEYFAGF